MDDTGKKIFPKFSGNEHENRPVTWCYQCEMVEGHEFMTNSVTIFSKPVLSYDESGENGHEKFAVVTLTRSEIADILKTLEEDIENLRKYCPDTQFE